MALETGALPCQVFPIRRPPNQKGIFVQLAISNKLLLLPIRFAKVAIC